MGRILAHIVDAVIAKPYCQAMTTILSADGSLEIPEAFRKTDGIKAGQRCEIERVGQGEYHVRVGPAVGRGEQPERLIDLLRSCPVKGFFIPLERSETTDDLKPIQFA
jgi:bifunctional DNA-binding transcriptional regulator/antitoxin component of YhaV-PrlF toxin-antitoxin module